MYGENVQLYGVSIRHECPCGALIYPEIHHLVLKTNGLVDILRANLADPKARDMVSLCEPWSDMKERTRERAFQTLSSRVRRQRGPGRAVLRLTAQGAEGVA
jgi:hypothetical protein